MEHTRVLMGTVFRVTVPDGSSPGAVDDVFAWLAHVEQDFSTFREDSVVSRLSRGEIARDDAPPEVRQVLARCDDLEASTGGRFHAVGAAGLDPSGYVKGWSVDEAALILRSSGIDRFAIYAGGDVLTSGPPPSGDRWRIGIRHPERPDDALATVVEVVDGAVATSGAYYRGEHIRGDGAGGVASATVTGASLGIADALATAIYADGARSLDFMDEFPGYGVLVLHRDGTMHTTAGVVTTGGRPSTMGERGE